jgi:two-component system cell cycle sensor histidine kinase/response regulator CckA
MTRPLRVLHLEDSARDAEMVRLKLDVEGLSCDILLANSKDSFEAALTREPFDVILSDYNLPGYDGVTALKQAQATQPDVPVILISGTVVEEEAVKCLHIGATDYLLKDHLDRLVPAVQRAIQEAETRRTRKFTERALVQREQALRENDERTNFALAAARMGVWEIEFATNRLTWSDTMAPLFGLTSDHAPKTTEGFFRLIHPDDRRATEASVERAIAGERDYVVEFRAIWPNGSAHWVHGRAQASNDADGKPLRLLGIAMDIDERKSLEDQLRQAQKLEAIGQLAGGVAHDFNNLLTVILGFSEMLIERLSPDDPGRADLLEIKKAGARAAGLTRQLLAFSRKQILQPKVLDVNALIRGMESMLRRLIVEHVDLTVSLSAHGALVKMDPTQFEQILVNLAVNAADAMPRGGKFTIETASVSLDEHYQQRHLPVTPGDYVMLAVSDTGVGMDEVTSRRIFEPFFTTKEIGKGTGLGLATVYGIVKQSGGDIRVDSAPGRGTTFRIYLPQLSAGIPRSMEPSAEARDVARGSETVLLVEDDEGVRLLAQVTLERSGYRVLQAENPKEAAQLAGEFAGPIHLLLSDVIMPESDGPRLLDRLVSARPAVRVLYMSGYADEAIRHVLMVEGTPFLQKPFTPHALTRKVREVLDAASPVGSPEQTPTCDTMTTERP